MKVTIYKEKAGKSDVLFVPVPRKRLPPTLLRGVAKGDLEQTVLATLNSYDQVGMPPAEPTGPA